MVSPIVVQSLSQGNTTLIDAFEYVSPSTVYGSEFTWTELLGLPVAVQYNTAFVLDDQLYSAGGYSASDGIISNVYRFDGIQWHEVAGLPAKRQCGMGAVYQGAFYFIGGNISGVAQTNVFRFDGDVWTEVPGLPSAREKAIAGVVDGKVTVAGGLNSALAATTNVFVFDGSSWSEASGLRYARSQQGGAVSHDELYAYGGLDSGGSATFNQYSFDGSGWTTEAGMNALLYGMASATLNEHVYSFGGRDDNYFTNGVFRYDGTSWERVLSMPATNAFSAASFWRGSACVLGGANSANEPQTNVYRLTDGGVSPIAGYPSGGYNVTICGTNLCDGSIDDVLSVTICGAAAEVIRAANTQIVVTAGSVSDPQTGDVVIQSGHFGTITASNAFTCLRGAISLVGTNGAIIRSGDAAAASNGSDFGTMPVGLTAFTNTFGFFNSGNDTLQFSGIVTGGLGAASFSVLSWSTNDLQPGATGMITVVCASMGGEQHGEISFMDNVPIDPSVPVGGHTVCVFRVKSYGTGAGMGADQHSLAFSATYADAAPDTQVMTITNTGNDVLACSNQVVYATAGNNWLTVTPAEGTLAVGGSLNFTNQVSLSDLNVGTHYATVQVYSATATNSPFLYSVELTIDKAAQVITYTSPGDQMITNQTPLDAACNSGLSPSYVVVSGPASMQNDRYPPYLTYHGAGEIIVMATQSGNLNYDAAEPVTQRWAVQPTRAEISLINLTQEYSGAAITVGAVVNPPDAAYIIRYDGLSAGPTNVGQYTVVGSIYDSDYYGGVTNTLTITVASQTITFPSIAAQQTDATVGLHATGGASGNPVTFAVASGPGSLDGTNLTFSGVGDVLVVASQAGTVNYTAAPDVTNLVRVFSVTPDIGPLTGGNVVTISNGSLGTVTNVLLGAPSVGSAIPDTTAANWLTLTMPAATNAGLIDITLQTTEYGDIRLADVYTYNPAGRIYTYDNHWDQWEEIAGLPAVRQGLVAGVLNGALYAYGGDNGSTECANTYRFNGSGWDEVASMPAARSYLSGAEMGDALYAIGGKYDGQSQDNVYRFDGNAWGEVANLPQPRQYGAATALDGAIYQLGGRDSGGKTNVYRFDGSQWSELRGLPTTMSYNGAASFNGTVYNVGGYNGSRLSTVYAFDDPTWSTVASLPGGCTTMGLATLGEYLYCIGGFNGSVMSSVNRYDGTNWTATVSLPQARRYLAAATLDGQIYAIGGLNGSVVSNVYRYPYRIEASGVSPAGSSWMGGVQVTISGIHLGDGDITNVTLCGASVTNIVSQSDTQVVVWAGQALYGGLGDVTVYSTSFGATTRSNAFTYTGPGMKVLGTNGEAITSGDAFQLANGSKFSPVRPGTILTNMFSITNSGTEALTISGWTTNGADADLFTLSGVPLSVNVGSAGNFKVVYEASSAGTHTATVEFANNSPSSPFLFNLGGSCFDVSTNIGPYAGGNSITVTNGYFGTITNVLLGAPSVGSAIPTAQGSSWFTITMPEIGTSGTVDLTVQTSHNGNIPLANAYTYNPAGILSTVSPSSGSWTGGYTVVFSGTNLCNGNSSDITQVTLAGMTAAVQNVYGSTQIVVVADASSFGFGTGDVVVVSTDFGTTTKSDAFELRKRSPEHNIQCDRKSKPTAAPPLIRSRPPAQRALRELCLIRCQRGNGIRT